MMNAIRFPLTLITLFFVAGIAAASHVMPPLNVLLLLSASAILIFAVISWTARRKPVFLILAPWGSAMIAFIIGGLVFMSHHASSNPTHFLRFLGAGSPSQAVELVISEKLKTTKRFDRFICEVRQLNHRQVSGRVLLNIEKGPFSSKLFPGHRLLIHAEVERHRPSLNPYQFDYGKYLDQKSVHAQLRVKSKDVVLLKRAHKGMRFYAAKVRNKIIRQLENSGFRQQELNVVLALVLGQQQEISPQVLKDYQFAGAVHILSVSGLHVGFILMFLNFFLDYLPYSWFRPYIKLLAVISGLWCFAIVAGLSPSVVRSVTMFSFVAVGMHIRRETNIFHTLLVSMLLILLARPSFLFDVGFQLSYASLFFILWVQPILAGYWRPGNRIGRHLFDILTVSFAAQLGAMPISIYYFHQFPGLFFVTNLLILPMVGVIMAVSVAVMLLALAGWTFKLPILVLEQMIIFLNRIIHYIASFEAFVIKDIPMNVTVLIASYLSTTALVLYLEKRRMPRLIACLGAIIVLQLTIIATLQTKHESSELIVLNSWRTSMLAERQGSKLLIKASDSVSEQAMRHTITPFAVANFCDTVRVEHLGNVHYFAGNRIFRIDSSAVVINCKPDVLLLTYSPRINLERVLTQYQPEMVVADASNYASYIRMWEKTCSDKDIKFHATTENGYYKITGH